MPNPVKNEPMNSRAVSNDHEQAISRFAKRLAWLLTLKHSLTFVAAWCFAWGTVALVLRATAASPRQPLLWGAIGIAIAIAAAAVIVRKRLPSRNSVRALLDERNDCGGLLMADADANIGEWRMPEIILPRLRFKSARTWGLFAASAAFVLASLL